MTETIAYSPFNYPKHKIICPDFTKKNIFTLLSINRCLRLAFIAL